MSTDRPSDGLRLTPRQKEVASLVARGMTNAEIAERLGITRNTVRTHLRLARRTLRAKNRAQLAAKYVEGRARE